MSAMAWMRSSGFEPNGWKVFESWRAVITAGVVVMLALYLAFVKMYFGRGMVDVSV